MVIDPASLIVVVAPPQFPTGNLRHASSRECQSRRCGIKDSGRIKRASRWYMIFDVL